MVDALDSKSSILTGVKVQVLSPAFFAFLIDIFVRHLCSIFLFGTFPIEQMKLEIIGYCSLLNFKEQLLRILILTTLSVSATLATSCSSTFDSDPLSFTESSDSDSSESDPIDQIAPTNSGSRSTSIISSVRVYMAKGTFASTEFEQFSLSKNALFFECGKLIRGKNIPAAQGVIPLEDSSSSDIVMLAMEILGRASLSDPLSLQQSEKIKSFGGSGKVILNLQTKNNKSAQMVLPLNEITEPFTELERNVLKLAVMLRTAVKDLRGDESICENEEFHGIS